MNLAIELTDGARLCDEDAAIEERGQRMAAARVRVIEEWAS